MEIPLLLGSTGLSIGGGLLSKSEAASNAANVADARNRVLNATLDKENAFANENRGTFNNLMPTFSSDAQKATQSKAADTRNADATAAIGAAPAVATVDIPSENGVVRGEAAKRMLDAFNQSTDLAKSRAQLGSFGDAWTGNNAAITDASRHIDTVNNFAKSQLGLLSSQQDLAGYIANKPSSGIGQVMQGLGSLGAMYSGAGMPGLSKLTGSAASVPFYGVGSSPY